MEKAVYKTGSLLCFAVMMGYLAEPGYQYTIAGIGTFLLGAFLFYKSERL
jgi:hypothetical protein